MLEDMIEMSERELKRLSVLESLKAGRMSQKAAGQLLGIQERQVRRLIKKFRLEGARGLISKKRGKPSNHQLPPGLKSLAIEIVKEHYADFGPTLAKEYLSEQHGINLSVETLRQAMIAAELWKPKRQKLVRIHQQRQRRACFGELVQIDGSPHDWFEGRADKCSLLVLVDDATSALLGLHFVKAESTQGYFKLLRDYFKAYGLPMALYSDRHSIFQVNNAKKNGPEPTQLGRAMDTLGVELILASSPQAKGRVEKANRTLQDRLIKAMRLKGISSIDDANAYLPEFIEQYNEKFAKPPRRNENAHCEIDLDNAELNKILSFQTKRRLSKALECSYQTNIFQIDEPNRKYRLQNKSVLICEDYLGNIDIYFDNLQLPYNSLDKATKPSNIADDKTINAKVDELTNKSKKRPTNNSPWRKFIINPKKHYSKTNNTLAAQAEPPSVLGD